MRTLIALLFSAATIASAPAALAQASPSQLDALNAAVRPPIPASSASDRPTTHYGSVIHSNSLIESLQQNGLSIRSLPTLKRSNQSPNAANLVEGDETDVKLHLIGPISGGQIDGHWAASVDLSKVMRKLLGAR